MNEATAVANWTWLSLLSHIEGEVRDHAGNLLMNLLGLVKSVRSRSHHSCAKCHLCVCLTGEPPQNSSERLIEKVAAGRESPSYHWLEQQISRTLYSEEVRRGASSVDIGLLGPAAFHAEACRILAEIRPEFAYLTDGRRCQDPQQRGRITAE